ncbi:MAG: hypothetical protein ACFFD8_10945 [Candidatus Thorarchaeota archaeon]
MQLELANQVLFVYRWVALVLFVIGFARILIRWTKPYRGPAEHTSAWLIDVSFRTKFVAFVKTVISDWTFGGTIRRQSLYRWVKHGFIIVGFVGLLLFHGVPRFILLNETILFPWATLELRIIAHDVLTALLVIGVIMAFGSRIGSKEGRSVTNLHNYVPLILLSAIALSGHLAFSYEYVLGIRGWFGIIHAFIIWTMIAVMFYSKFQHIIATPIIMVRSAIEKKWEEEYIREITGVEEYDVK